MSDPDHVSYKFLDALDESTDSDGVIDLDLLLTNLEASDE